EAERDRVRARADREMKDAREKAAQLVSRTRAQADALLNELEELKKRRGRALTAEQKARLNAGLREMDDAADPVARSEDDGYRLPRPLKAGDTVLLSGIGKKATVLRP
ncbi:MAG TPA: endonuclease MutS2, partial [Ruminococcaceae bacterium]|nr:endonuclease MutS2 [Oscillospiraceae bacterium]